MTNEQIETFFSNAKLTERRVKIDFKTRSSMVGLFIDTPDAAELNSKNFWRIVSESKIEDFLAKRDLSLARIFNGSEMTRLGLLKAKV